MEIANMSTAKSKLSALVKKALCGEQIYIARANELLVRLVPVTLDTTPRVGGQWAGQVQRSENYEFTEHEIENLFYAPITSGDA
jgi:antitoxin (DNA-binding transcriptional repressor) of toxin-antitoxin stability system